MDWECVPLVSLSAWGIHVDGKTEGGVLRWDDGAGDRVPPIPLSGWEWRAVVAEVRDVQRCSAARWYHVQAIIADAVRGTDTRIDIQVPGTSIHGTWSAGMLCRYGHPDMAVAGTEWEGFVSDLIRRIRNPETPPGLLAPLFEVGLREFPPVTPPWEWRE